MDILVADDSSAIQKVVRIAFKDSQFRLEEVETLDDFINKVNAHKPKVILADPLLPGLDGPSDLREIVGKIPVVLLVGTYDQINENQWKQAGFPHIMKKPFDGRALVELVSHLVRHGTDHGSLKLPKVSSGSDVSKLEMSLMDNGTRSESPALHAPLTQSEDRGKRAFADLEFSQLNFAEFSMGSTKIKPSAAAREQTGVSKLPDLPMTKNNDPKPFRDESSHGPLDLAISKSLNEFDFNSSNSTKSPRDSQFASTPSQPAQLTNSHYDMDTLVASIWPRLQELIRSEVRQYLDGQIKSQIPQLAKEVIMSEIRRLTDEKARINIDR